MLIDLFSLRDVSGNRNRGQLLRRFHIEFYYGLEAQRELHKREILHAIRAGCLERFAFDSWSRIVDHRFSDAPLSPAGSMLLSGRFNVGADINPARFPTFPVLYFASDHPTAYCEKFGLQHDEESNGLTPEELFACRGKSWTNVALRGEVHRVLDLTDTKAVAALCKIFARFSIPAEAMKAARRAGLAKPRIVRSAKEFYQTTLAGDWRVQPSQFNLPANSQILGRLATEAGCEAILYPSRKYPSGRCLAVFTRTLGDNRSFVELQDTPVPFVINPKIDSTSSSLW